MGAPSPPPAPEPFDAAQAAGEYYYGKDFGELDGILDPRFQEAFLDSERTYGPQYAQLQLDNISTMAQGADGEGGIFGILRDASRDAGALQREELGLQRADDLTAVQDLAPQIVDAFRAADEESTLVAEAADARIGQGTGIGALGQSLIGSQLGEAGAEEQAIRQRGLADITAGREAASATEQALQAQGLSDLGAQREGASTAEQAIRQRGLSSVDAGLLGASSGEQALQDRALAGLNAQVAGASPAEQQLQALAMSQSALGATPQEALLAQQGMQALGSTGELSALENLRLTDSIRESSLARGREGDMSSIAAEARGRFAEELNKKERDQARGAQLLGSSDQMRQQRLAQGASALTGVDALSAQRRAEQMQQQQFGAQNVGATEAFAAQRRGEQMQQQQFGTQALSQAEAFDAQRRAEQVQRQGFGAQNLGQVSNIEAQRRAEEMARQGMGASALGASAGLSAGRRNELLQQQQLGAGLVGAEDSIQSGRLGQSFAMNRNLSGDLGSTILGRPSQSIPLGQSILGSATQGANNLGGALFDQNAGVNVGLQQRGQNLNYQSAIYEGQSGQFGGLMQGFGALAGGALSGGTGSFGSMLGGKIF